MRQRSPKRSVWLYPLGENLFERSELILLDLNEKKRKLTTQHKNMKRILGYALLIVAGMAILAPLAYVLPLPIFFGAVGSALLLTLAVIKGIEWTL